MAEIPINNPIESNHAEEDAEKKGKSTPPDGVPDKPTVGVGIKQQCHTYKTIKEGRKWWVVLVQTVTAGAVIWYACIASKELTQLNISNDSTRVMFRTTQRAFIFTPNDFQVDGAVETKAREKMWYFTFSMENSGNTPARIDGNHINSNNYGTKATWEPLPSNFDFPDSPTGGSFPNPNNQSGRASIPPHQKWNYTAMAIPDSVFERVNGEKAHVYVWGWVSYTDVIGCSHKTEFAKQVTSVQPMTPGKPRTFFIDNYPGHNCADKECKGYQPTDTQDCRDELAPN
jgi:hypothetical protein